MLYPLLRPGTAYLIFLWEMMQITRPRIQAAPPKQPGEFTISMTRSRTNRASPSSLSPQAHIHRSSEPKCIFTTPAISTAWPSHSLRRQHACDRCCTALLSTLSVHNYLVTLFKTALIHSMPMLHAMLSTLTATLISTLRYSDFSISFPFHHFHQ